MAHIFISYATADRASAAEIAAALKDNGYDVWWDRELVGGDDYQRVIAKALEDAEAVIVLWSQDAVDSRWVRGEAETAASAGKLVPMRLDTFDASRLPIGFKAIHTVPVADRAGLLTALQKLRVERSARPRTPLSMLLSRQGRRLRGLLLWFSWPKAIAIALALGLAGYAYLDYVDWSRISESPEEGDFERQIARYPFGLFRARAEARLAGREPWKTVRQSRDPADFEGFLKRYPGSLYAPLAAVRVNRLRQVASGGYKSVIPDSSDRQIKAAELANLSCERLWTARNEVYYRSGWCFITEEAMAAFSTTKDCPYTSCPSIRAINAIIDKHIQTPLERSNILLIRDTETKLGCRVPNVVGHCAAASPRR